MNPAMQTGDDREKACRGGAAEWVLAVRVRKIFADGPCNGLQVS